MPRRLLLTFVAGATLTLPACGSVVLSADTLSAAELSAAAEDALEQERGVRPDITCPEELAKEEGASTRCTLSGADGAADRAVTVTVSSTDGTTQIRVEVGDELPEDEPAEGDTSG